MIDIDKALSIAILGFFLVTMLNFTYFFNWMSLINLLLKIMAPNRKFEEVERDMALYKNKQFKKHLRKWRIIFLFNIVVFIGPFFISLLVLKNLLAASFVGVISIVIGYGVLSELENKARKKVISLINQNSKANQGDANQGDDSLID